MSKESVSVKVVGAERFGATLTKATEDIAHLRDGFDRAGKIITEASRAASPVRTGALRASIESMKLSPIGVVITSDLIYAGPVHWGRVVHPTHPNPFVLRGAASSEGSWGPVIQEDAQRICDSVRGA